MICSIEGKLLKNQPMEAIVEAGGIGYQIRVPLSTSRKLPSEGSIIKLLTCYMIRDESPELYGFITEEEWKTFQKLILLPGVGPKLALRILSGLSPEEIYHAVISQDIEIFKKTPGVGRKIAERLIVEMKNQIDFIEESPGKPGGKNEMIRDAVEALTVLGYKRSEAFNLAKKTAAEFENKKITLEEFIREILKRV
ncbi:MAG: Holliday junction branch migration protein RuvA [Candidatus Omnitrophica bacterium]|nr:Holliday junction branch migration protein RuvA [Candidatus Omnitrophota bacterium]